MAWKKVSPELADFLAAKVSGYAVEPRKMFGCPVYFVAGNMFAGCHEDNIMMRLSAPDMVRFLAEHDEAAPFEPLAGRPMKEYAAVPESVYADKTVFDPWLRRSYDYVASLPPAKKKEKKENRPGPRTGGGKKSARTAKADRTRPK